MKEMLMAAKAAKSTVGRLTTERKNAALMAMADCLLAHQVQILKENQLDLDAASGKIGDVMLDRLRLTPQRIAAMAQGIRDVAALRIRWGMCWRSTPEQMD